MIFSPENFSSQNHACTLNTITSIEHFIFKNSGQYSKTELWNVLPKKIMYQSYKIVLEYLFYSNKISIQNKKVVWISKSKGLDLDKFTAQNHSCTLNTIINIQKFIGENSGLFSKTDLWKALPKKIMYQSYKVVLEYLLISNQISISNKKVVLGGEN